MSQKTVDRLAPEVTRGKHRFLQDPKDATVCTEVWPMKFITKPCERCGEAVVDVDDPNYNGKWTCYHCHCLLTGRDPRRVLNNLVQLMKLRRLVYRKPSLWTRITRWFGRRLKPT